MSAFPMWLAPLVRETTTTTGAGPVTLAGAVPGFFAFTAVGEGATVAVPYKIDWDFGTSRGAEWGIGRLDAAGTVLTRHLVLGTNPGGLRSDGSLTPLALPAGAKNVSLVPLDIFAVAATPNGLAAGDLDGNPAYAPVADGDRALAAGMGAHADGDDAVALGATAYAPTTSVAVGAQCGVLHDHAVALGFQCESIGGQSFTARLGPGVMGEQCFAGVASSGTSLSIDTAWFDPQAAHLTWFELTAVAANLARTQFRAFRRKLLVGGATIVATASDEVLVSSLGTVPTLTLSIGAAPDQRGFRPLHLLAGAAGATTVDWRIFVRALSA